MSFAAEWSFSYEFFLLSSLDFAEGRSTGFIADFARTGTFLLNLISSIFVTSSAKIMSRAIWALALALAIDVVALEASVGTTFFG